MKTKKLSKHQPERKKLCLLAMGELAQMIGRIHKTIDGLRQRIESHRRNIAFYKKCIQTGEYW